MMMMMIMTVMISTCFISCRMIYYGSGLTTEYWGAVSACHGPSHSIAVRYGN